MNTLNKAARSPTGLDHQGAPLLSRFAFPRILSGTAPVQLGAHDCTACISVDDLFLYLSTSPSSPSIPPRRDGETSTATGAGARPVRPMSGTIPAPSGTFFPTTPSPASSSPSTTRSSMSWSSSMEVRGVMDEACSTAVTDLSCRRALISPRNSCQLAVSETLRKVGTRVEREVRGACQTEDADSYSTGARDVAERPFGVVRRARRRGSPKPRTHPSARLRLPRGLPSPAPRKDTNTTRLDASIVRAGPPSRLWHARSRKQR